MFGIEASAASMEATCSSVCGISSSALKSCTKSAISPSARLRTRNSCCSDRSTLGVPGELTRKPTSEWKWSPSNETPAETDGL